METAVTAGLINQLTTDNDEQQELWVQYLRYNDASALSRYLSKIRNTFSEEQLLQITIWRRAKSNPERSLLQLFDQFTDLEQSVMHLLALGATLEEISSIKAISMARMRHIVCIIRENDIWEDLNGA